MKSEQQLSLPLQSRGDAADVLGRDENQNQGVVPLRTAVDSTFPPDTLYTSPCAWKPMFGTYEPPDLFGSSVTR